jgi:hypothetical protein
MAPKSKQPRTAQRDLSAELQDGKDARINLGDTGSLKRALDDVVVDVRGAVRPLVLAPHCCRMITHCWLALQELKATDYAIDYTYFDLKLGLGLAA